MGNKIPRWSWGWINIRHEHPTPTLWNVFFRKKNYKMLCKHDDIHLCFEGHETKAMLNNNGPRYKRSKIERRMNVDIFLCVGLLFTMCLVGSIGMKHWQKSFVWFLFSTWWLKLILQRQVRSDLELKASGFWTLWSYNVQIKMANLSHSDGRKLSHGDKYFR